MLLISLKVQSLWPVSRALTTDVLIHAAAEALNLEKKIRSTQSPGNFLSREAIMRYAL